MTMKKPTNIGKTKNTGFSKNTTKHFFFLASIALIFITAVVYLESLNHSFITQWDDTAYVVKNDSLLASVNKSAGDNLKELFTSYVAGNYHPLTMLSYYIEYNYFGLNPKPYHVVNLLIHIFNSLLVMLFVWLLSKQKWVAFITALLFAIHPMHVESVAWVSERKDVLYTFFYIAALCAYTFFINKGAKNWLVYLAVFLLFVCSCLSKAMAVTLPVLLIGIDLYKERNLSIKVILEKTPLVIISVIIGLVAIKAQDSANAYHKFDYDFLDRILFSCYGLCMYVGKLFVPIDLKIFYPYPPRINGLFPIIFYSAPLFIMAILFGVYKLKAFRKHAFFGLFFYVLTIALVLQLFPVGGSLAFERYTYIPYIGVFFILTKAFNNLLEDEKLKRYRATAIAALTMFIIGLAYTSYQRTKIWKDNISVFDDFVKKTDYKVAESLNSRGAAYALANQHNKAIIDFTKALQLQDKAPNILFSRAMSYGSINKPEEAVADFTLALKYDSTLTDAYFNRANSLFNLKKYREAISDFDEAIRLSPETAQMYFNRAVAYETIGYIKEALNDYATTVKLKPDFAEAYRKIGLIHYNKTRNYKNALEAYSKALKYDESTVYLYFNRAITNYELKNYAAALKDAQRAQKLGYNVPEMFFIDVESKLAKIE